MNKRKVEARVTARRPAIWPYLLIAIALLTALLAGGAFVMNAMAGGGGCTDADAPGETGSDDLVSFTAPEGNTITGVCIKSGANMFDDGHSGKLGNGTYEEDSNGRACYEVSDVGTGSVTVERVGPSGSECQAISHVDVYYEVTPTDTPVPTDTPEPTETPDPTETPTEGPSPTPTDTPEVTATPTDRPEPTKTPPPQPPDDNSGIGGSGLLITWLLTLLGSGSVAVYAYSRVLRR